MSVSVGEPLWEDEGDGFRVTVRPRLSTPAGDPDGVPAPDGKYVGDLWREVDWGWTGVAGVVGDLRDVVDGLCGEARWPEAAGVLDRLAGWAASAQS